MRLGGGYIPHFQTQVGAGGIGRMELKALTKNKINRINWRSWTASSTNLQWLKRISWGEREGESRVSRAGREPTTNLTRRESGSFVGNDYRNLSAPFRRAAHPF